MKSLIILTLFAGAVAPPPDSTRAPEMVVASQDAARTDAVATGPQIDINTATTTQLEALPGVGPATAKRIVEYREQNGPFKKIEDLMHVRGIGEKSFLKLRPQITVGKAADARPASTQP